MTRLTISLTVILYEITDDAALMLPIMFAVLVSRTVAIRLQSESLYHVLLDAKRIPVLLEGGDGHYDVGPGGLDVLPVSAAMATPPKCVSERPPASAIVALLRDASHHAFPVLNGDGRALGTITRDHLLALLQRHRVESASTRPATLRLAQLQHRSAPATRPILSDTEADDLYAKLALDDRPVDLAKYVHTSAIKVFEDFSLARALILYQTLGLRTILVTDVENRAVGVITRQDLLPFHVNARADVRDPPPRDTIVGLPVEVGPAPAEDDAVLDAAQAMELSGAAAVV